MLIVMRMATTTELDLVYLIHKKIIILYRSLAPYNKHEAVALTNFIRDIEIFL